MGFAMNAYKLNQIFPPPTNPELSSNKNQSALQLPSAVYMLSLHVAAHMCAASSSVKS